jgi:hypothetical protein
VATSRARSLRDLLRADGGHIAWEIATECAAAARSVLSLTTGRTATAAIAEWDVRNRRSGKQLFAAAERVLENVRSHRVDHDTTVYARLMATEEMGMWWNPDFLPTLAELELWHGATVQPQVDYGVFCRWQEALEAELGPEKGRLCVDRSATACEHGWWCVALFPSAAQPQGQGRYRLAPLERAAEGGRSAGMRYVSLRPHECGWRVTPRF